jgi:hypothetical protein
VAPQDSLDPLQNEPLFRIIKLWINNIVLIETATEIGVTIHQTS